MVEEELWSDGKIYRLHALGLEDFCYIGSTVQTLHRRLLHHKNIAASGAQYKCASAPLFEEGNEVVIELIEDFPCETRTQLLERESYWIQQFPEALNKNTPILNAEERLRRRKACMLAGYYKKHEERKAAARAWKAANKDHIAAYNETYAPIKKEKAKAREALPEVKAKRAAAKKVIIKCDICQKEMNKNSIWLHKSTVHKPATP